MQGGALSRASVPHWALALWFDANPQDQRCVLLDSQTAAAIRKTALCTGKDGGSCCPLLLSSLLGPFPSQGFSHTISTGDVGPGCLCTVHLTPYLHQHRSQMLSLEFPHLRHGGRKETMQNSLLLLLCCWLSVILARCFLNTALGVLSSTGAGVLCKWVFLSSAQHVLIKGFREQCVSPQSCISNQALQIILVYTNTWEPLS